MMSARKTTSTAKKKITAKVQSVSQLPQLDRSVGRSEASATLRLQALLTLFRYQLQTDGFFGPQTERAVEEFQASSGLSVDGTVGSRTWELLLFKKIA